MKKCISILLSSLLLSVAALAQDFKTTLHKHIDTLAGPSMHGRGYVFDGGEIAAQYIAGQFAKVGLDRFDNSYFQEYTFPINTFPGNASLTINKTKLLAGKDYIVDASSNGWHKGNLKVTTFDFTNIKDKSTYVNTLRTIKVGNAYYFYNVDTPTKYLKIRVGDIASELPKALYIVPQHGKITWSANQHTIDGTIIYLEDTVLSSTPQKVDFELDNRLIKNYRAKNVIGYIKGTAVPDSFIVFSAHYDHLGHLGKDTYFAGANDNASGTSLLLYLAEYFAQHPQRYSVAFMLFSGEEAGLLGSKHYTSNPLFPLGQIRFVVNIDLAGEAKNGITVVNGVSRKMEFDLLQTLNTQRNYLTDIKIRDQAANSDHYFFCENNVPAIFIYTNGTKPYYHDIYDLPAEITLEKIDKFSDLLIDFTNTITNSN